MGHSVARVQKVQKVQRVQRVVDSRFAAMFIKTALRDSLPTLRVILNEVKNLGAGSL